MRVDRRTAEGAVSLLPPTGSQGLYSGHQLGGKRSSMLNYLAALLNKFLTKTYVHGISRLTVPMLYPLPPFSRHIKLLTNWKDSFPLH